MTNATLNRAGSSPETAPRAALQPSLFVCYQGGRALLNNSGLGAYKKSFLDDRMQRVWNKAVEVFNANNNPSFRVNITDLFVVVTDPETGQDFYHGIGEGDSVEGQDLLKECLALNALIRGCFGNIRGGRSVGSLMNRPLVTARPFQSIPRAEGMFSKFINRPARALSGMSSTTFIDKHLGGLTDAGSAEWGGQKKRVLEGDALVNRFSTVIQSIISGEKGGLDLASLSKLETMICERNRYALYWALALSKAEAQKGTIEDRQKNANEISDAVYKSLSSMYPDLESQSVIYSREVGDLVLHNPIEYLQRVDQDNQIDPAHSRNVTGPSIEEFFIHVMLRDKSVYFDLKKSLGSLGIFFGAEVQKKLEDALDLSPGLSPAALMSAPLSARQLGVTTTTTTTTTQRPTTSAPPPITSATTTTTSAPVPITSATTTTTSAPAPITSATTTTTSAPAPITSATTTTTSAPAPITSATTTTTSAPPPLRRPSAAPLPFGRRPAGPPIPDSQNCTGQALLPPLGLQQSIAEKEQSIASKQQSIAEKELRIKELERGLKEKENAIAAIQALRNMGPLVKISEELGNLINESTVQNSAKGSGDFKDLTAQYAILAGARSSLETELSECKQILGKEQAQLRLEQGRLQKMKGELGLVLNLRD